MTGRIQRAQSDHQVAQRRQVVRGVRGARRRGVFAEGDIPHIVDAFYSPVAAPKGLQPRQRLSGFARPGGCSARSRFLRSPAGA